MMRFICVLFLCVLLTTAASSAYVPCDLCVERASETMLAEMKLILYQGPSIDDHKSVLIGDALELLDDIDSSKPIVLYIFGFLDNPNSSSSHAMVQAYLDLGGHNILMLDWSNISDNDPVFVARSVESVGYYLATALNQLSDSGMDISGLHIVAHSLGAEASGYTGRYVNFTVPRITGLDPAGPGFYVLMEHLASGDAGFVDVIHTDRLVLGIALQIGDVDFYPNGGLNVQPGCTKTPVLSDFCSHFRAVYYYAGSVVAPNSFVGVACSSYTNFKDGSCESNETAIMGYATPRDTRGRYYLQTNSQSPYGRGKDGTRYRADSVLGSITGSLL